MIFGVGGDLIKLIYVIQREVKYGYIKSEFQFKRTLTNTGFQRVPLVPIDTIPRA